MIPSLSAEAAPALPGYGSQRLRSFAYVHGTHPMEGGLKGLCSWSARAHCPRSSCCTLPISLGTCWSCNAPVTSVLVNMSSPHQHSRVHLGSPRIHSSSSSAEPTSSSTSDISAPESVSIDSKVGSTCARAGTEAGATTTGALVDAVAIA